MDLKDKLYYTKFLLALRTVLVCHIFTLLDAFFSWKHMQAYGVLFGWVMLVVDYLMFLYVFKVDYKQLGGKGKLFMVGIGTYILGWVSIWTITYTLLHYILWPEIWITYNINPALTLIILALSLGIVFGTSLLARLLIDMPRMKRYQNELAKHKTMEKEANETKNRKLMIKVKRKKKYIEKIQRKIMWQRLKPTLLTLVPFIVMFAILNILFKGILVAVFPFNASEAPLIGMFIQGRPISPRGFGLSFFGWYLCSSFGLSFLIQKLMGIKFRGMGGGLGGLGGMGR